VLLTAHYEAGRTQMQLGRHALALAAFNRAAELDQGELGPRLRMQRAFALARSGEHAAAAAEARAMREPARGVGPALYDLARTYGFCLTAVAADEKLSAADRMRLVEEYAAAALGLLEETKAAGYFAEPANVDELRADAAFQAISSRAEFRMLLDGLKSGM
jgi:tetratricopeptide (TPR) repeat protein